MVYECTLSPELQKKALDELHEDPKRRQADIEYIREWINQQPHLNARTDDWTILRFLRGCKFSLERTKEKIDMFYTCKTAVPEWFKNRDPTNQKTIEILKMGGFFPLRGHDSEGRSIMVGRSLDLDLKTYTLDDVMKTVYMMVDVIAEEDEMGSVAGVINVQDLANFKPAHMLLFTPTATKKMMTIYQDGYPMRPKGIHYINTPSTFESIFSIFKAFMKEKMRKRVQVHGSNMESLHKAVPKELLPKEYGGSNGTVQEITDYWVEKVLARRDWLIEDEKYGVDESKRPGKPKTSSDLFGLEGSFRKLDVD